MFFGGFILRDGLGELNVLADLSQPYSTVFPNSHHQLDALHLKCKNLPHCTALHTFGCQVGLMQTPTVASDRQKDTEGSNYES